MKFKNFISFYKENFVFLSNKKLKNYNYDDQLIKYYSICHYE